MDTRLKKVNQTAVRRLATTLILAQGYTTALGVRQSLRKQGYWGSQMDVVAFLYDVAQREGWDINDNGPLRVYRFPTLRRCTQ